MRGRTMSATTFGAVCVARDDRGTRKIWPEWRAESWSRPASSRPKSRRCAAVGLEFSRGPSLGPSASFTLTRLRTRSRSIGPTHLLAPYKGSGGLTVQAPLKRGLSPPPGGDWGFLVSCRRRGAGRGKKPSVTASPCHLPFQGRFWRADIVHPYEWMRPMSEKRRAGLGPAPTKERAESSRPTGMGCTPKITGRGRELYVSIHLFPKFVPRHAKNRAGCIIGYTLPGVLCGKAHLRGGEGSCRRLTAAARGPEPEV